MRRMTLLLPAVPLVLAGALLAARAGGADDEQSDRPVKVTTTTTTVTAAPTTTTPAPKAEAAPVATATTAAGNSFLCPEGGMDAVRALQHEVDQGHQPWRLTPTDVAAACTFGVPGSQVEAVGPDRYEVVDGGTGRRATVELGQPLGPGTIWVVTAVSYGA